MVAVPTADRAIALAEAWLAPRAEALTVERSRATLVEGREQFKAVTDFGPWVLGPNGYQPRVWVVTLGATWPGETSRRALRYVIDARTGKFLVQSMPMPGSLLRRGPTNLTTN
jgi:hypothetical protein